MDNELIEKYNKIASKIKDLREDIKCTEQALTDPKLDWMTVKEYKNDIVADRRQLLECEEVLNGLFDYLIVHHMKEEITEITHLKEENNYKK